MTKRTLENGDILTSQSLLEEPCTTSKELKAIPEQAEQVKQVRKAGAQKGKPHKLTGKYSKMAPESRQLSTQNIGKALLMHRQGHMQTDIAKVLGCHPITVARTIEKFSPIFNELENVVDFREARADILDAAQLTTIKSLVSPERMETARLGEVAKTFDVLYKAGRLERGQSTQNVASTFTRISADKFKPE